MKTRMYHLVSINMKNESLKVQLTGYPMPHHQCMTMKSKFTKHAHRRIQVVEEGIYITDDFGDMVKTN